ncbi:MAG: phosphoribosylglycinamide formyltransferase [Melioribacteraceae bacterium]|nr:phosphoribosylglycinamide formyltransferase [Melioribacteraceae bacterium]
MLKIAVFVSGRGSNLNSLINFIKENSVNAEISAVVSDKIDCPAFEIAKKNNISCFSVKQKIEEKFYGYEDLLMLFKKIGINFIVLAGYLKMIPADFVRRFQNRIINIHPALLPSFGGKGMYGMNVHKAVFESSAKVSGATVHFVNEKYDEGKIIAQRCVDISSAESPEEIAESVLREEHRLLPQVIKNFAENKIVVENNRVRILE